MIASDLSESGISIQTLFKLANRLFGITPKNSEREEDVHNRVAAAINLLRQILHTWTRTHRHLRLC
ncbi:hypothetical protein [Prochlorococcus sp. MIT 1307]|uniref:hypothetical protein n=1 Tax=Prochlorococcus sp. MIT 1307 TaxID=3096219 RepID=UPI002A764F86|nr:hypothetical protein [Prochlorococcus sp. MIT 1307]